MKKFLAMVLSLIMMVSVPVTCFAASDSVTKSNTEFGTLTGTLKVLYWPGESKFNI